MASRLNLHEIFCGILGNRNAYFQPLPSVQMKYPAIKYSLSDIDTKFADDISYLQTNCYQITVIDYDPDSELVKKVLALPLCNFDRFYTADNLNHWVFKLYY